MQALENFLAKGVLTSDRLIRFVQCSNTASNDSGPSSGQPVPSWDCCVEEFMSTVLKWISYTDLAPTAGHLFSAFFRVLEKQQTQETPYYNSVNGSPLWTSPVLQTVKTNPDTLEALRHQVFSKIFRLRTADFRKYLQALGIDNVLSGSPVTNDEYQTLLLFSVLQSGKDLGLVQGSGASIEDSNRSSDAVIVSDTIVGRLLPNSSPVVRIASLSLLITSPSILNPFSVEALSLLRYHLEGFYADTDAKFRTDVLSLSKRLIERVKGAMSYLSRELSRMQRPEKLQRGKEPCQRSVEETQARLRQHTDFLTWYISFLLAKLRPTAPYQLHITSLKALNLMIKAGVGDPMGPERISRSLHKGLASPLLTRNLLDLLMDPFDDVRSAAAVALKGTASTMVFMEGVELKQNPSQAINSKPSDVALPPGNISVGLESLTNYLFLSRAEALAHRTGRADHSDGVARSWELVFESCKTGGISASSISSHGGDGSNSLLLVVEQIILRLENNLAIASEDLAAAVASNPVHAQFVSLRYIFDRPDFYSFISGLDRNNFNSWKNLHYRAIGACHAVWQIVRSVLCDDAPEGHMPEDFEGGGEDISTKDLLSYSWRALKEASSLLKIIISKAPYSASPDIAVLDVSHIRLIGDITFIQLADLRHRGAFSTVSLTFASCCQRCSQSIDADIRSMPILWYKQTLDRIRDQASAITRRSAGLPSLVTGILSANLEGAFFTDVMADLQLIAQAPVQTTDDSEVELPQVHALNCLKDIFRGAKLSAISEPYIAGALDLAATSLSSHAWPIRNCGMMLLRALIDRLLGNSEPQMSQDPEAAMRSLKLDYKKYTNLPNLLVRLLDIGTPHKQQVETGETQATIQAVLPASAAIEGVFPALEILRRAGAPEGHSGLFQGLVLGHLSSDKWLVRDMAARTYCSLMHPADYVQEVERVLGFSSLSQNAYHGRLLCVRYILEASQMVIKDSWNDYGESLLTLLDEFYVNLIPWNSAPATMAAYLETINTLLTFLLKSGATNLTDRVPQIISRFQIFEDMQQNTALLIQSSTEIRDSSFPVNLWAESSLLRPAVAWFMSVYYCTTSRYDLLGKLVLLLSREDPDAACAFLDRMEQALLPAMFHKELQSGLCHVIIETSSLAVRSLCVSKLNNSLENSPPDALPVALLKSAEAVTLAFASAASTAGPSTADAALIFHGHVLSLEIFGDDDSSDTLGRKLFSYSRMLSFAGHESKDYTTREAAANSLKAFKAGFRPRGSYPRTLPCFLGLYFTLYDILNDDDDEIRDKGAEVVSWILSDPSKDNMPTISLIPLAASRKLADFLVENYTQSSQLHDEALMRVVGQQLQVESFPQSKASASSSDSKALDFRPFKEILSKYLKEDTTLFVEEKQNLFVDPVREIDIWSQVLLRLSSVPITSASSLTSKFTTWVSEGLETLLSATADHDTDGPLGWTTKPEVFALGIRVICAAGVVLEWGERENDKILDRAVIENIRGRLESLTELGQKRRLHEMWIERLEELRGPRSR
ncbi:MAG: hypothetical protein M1819_006660 [Sarea resinae]|nr:MAG: hypothetical protein M1819_006660 [Sarea resinae]